MIGSTAAGVSAAGTVEIIAGTSGILGTAASVIAAPVTVIAAGITAVGAAGLEGTCYFVDERITDYDQVLKIMQAVAARAKIDDFQLVDDNFAGQLARIRVKIGPDEYEVYNIVELYIVNGQLKNRDWFLNTDIGSIAAVMPAMPAKN